MKIKIRMPRSFKIRIFPAIVLFLCFCEFLYARNSGDRTNIVLGLLCVFGLCYNIIIGVAFTVSDFICYLIAGAAVLYSLSSEGVRYGLTLVALINWSKIRIKNMTVFVEGLIGLSAVMCVFQKLRGVGRVSGVFANSPTQLSCLLWVCLVYLLICMVNSGFDFVRFAFATICLPMIYMTETRSTLASGLLVYCAYMYLLLLKCGNVRNRFRVILISIMVAGCVFLFSFSSFWALLESKMSRSNSNASSLTRLSIYKVLFNRITENAHTLLFGRGGGYVEQYLMKRLNVSTYFPSHQDFILITTEYGLIGLFFVFFFYLREHRVWLYFMLVFLVCSFHNIVLTPTTMIFMAITLGDLDHRGYSIFPIRIKDRERMSAEHISNKRSVA